MKRINNISLIIVTIVTIILWRNNYVFEYNQDWTETIFKIVLLFTLLLFVLNNLISKR